MKTYTVEVCDKGGKYWRLNGKYHREDGPAIEYEGGSKFWYLNGKYHREDGPAIECSDGTKAWYINGNELSQAEFNARNKPKPTCAGMVVEVDGKKAWYVNGNLHREDGPAIEWANGDKKWWLDGKLHRLDGPAVEWANGTKEWYINGNELSQAEFNARNKPKPTCAGKVVEIDGKKYKLVEV